MTKALSRFKTYFSLTKPGIVMGNALTCAGGFALASRGHYDLFLFLATLFGLCLVVAAGCVSNNYIDRFHDEKMARTKNRVLVKGEVSLLVAKCYALVLFLAGMSLLSFWVNLLSATLAFFGLLVYIVFYSYLKYRSAHATLIGSVAGAIPPVVGYCAVSHRFDLAALIFFLMIAIWQMPHFYAIAMYRLEEYAVASIPVLPVKKGIQTTKNQMLFYIVVFILISSILSMMQFVGYMYLITVTILSLGWLALCLAGFKQRNDQRWARKMFFVSLVVVLGVCSMIPLTVI